MQVTDELIRTVVQEVLAHVRKNNGPSPSSNGHSRSWGVFEQVNDAVAAAVEAQRQFVQRSLEDRRRAIQCVRTICLEQAEMLGREELEETKVGRLEHKIEKLQVVAKSIPGVEFLRTEAFSGENGITLTEYAPFGVIGAITPVTHSLPTLACNAINMLAGGNSLVCNPHPNGARIACKGTRLFNQAIHEAIGIDNLITILSNPTLESAQGIFNHRDIHMICVTGGAGLARAALRSPKRAVVAGPGNPPVVVDETADLENAARCIVAGGSYDNNLLCISEKEVFAVEAVLDRLLEAMAHHRAVQLTAGQIEALTAAAFGTGEGDRKTRVLNKDLIGKDAAVLAQQAGITVPQDTLLLFGETDESNPFVDHEQMMPFVPFVRVRDVDTAIALAKKYEHGFKHTAIIHSRNLETITRMGRALDTTIFVQNGPCMAGNGAGGEGFMSYTIATPTGEGITTPLTFTRQRRSVTVGTMRVI